MALLRGVGNGVWPPILLPLQLPDDVWGIGGFESAPHETEAFANELELCREHVLLLEELA